MDSDVSKNISGLTSAQVEASRTKYGNNKLSHPPRRPLFLQFFDKFNDPLIKILLVALLLSMGLSLYEHYNLGRDWSVLFEPAGIFIAIVLATLIGFLVEVSANKKFNVLIKMNDDILVTVKRDGKVKQVSRWELVVGDIVLLDTGDKAPADGILLKSVNMDVDESSFTGEPVAFKSHREADADPNATYPTNRVLRASTVTQGHGVMRVDRVGDSTEYGRIFKEAQIDNKVKTPLMMQFDHLGKLIATGSYIIAALIVVGRIVAFFVNGVDETPVETASYFINTIMLAVTLIVVSVPEGLPMSVTLSLALSMHRMLRTNNLVRKMHACETMGATTVICTDKTGTLTQNQMRVADKMLSGEEGTERLVPLNFACNGTSYLEINDNGTAHPFGNPTEGALLLYLHQNGIDYMNLREQWNVEAQEPFSYRNKYMATVVENNGARCLLMKGAPELVYEMCHHSEGDVPWEEYRAKLDQWQHAAMRTLGFASKILKDDEMPIVKGKLQTTDLVFDGIVAISDPVRPEVPDAIRECAEAGIEVKIVTGDAEGTSVEVARQVGIEVDETTIISGPDFAELPDDEAAQCAKRINIMYRARPDDKLRLVKLLQQSGEVVAVTGDGTNDAPALNAAQVGLSMGDGTSAAKEASDITIIDNSFASIGKAVMWGRSLYKNIQRFILFQLTVNVAACLLVAVCSFFSRTPALTVTQMLWVNLIMDTFAALALASLPPSNEVMKEKPRRQGEKIITRHMSYFIGFVGLFCASMMIAIFFSMTLLRDSHIISSTEAAFFSTFVFFQFWNMFNARAFRTKHSVFSNWHGTAVFWMVMAVIFIGQIVIVQYLSPMFDVSPLDLKSWLVVICITSPVLLIGEGVRACRAWRHKRAK